MPLVTTDLSEDEFEAFKKHQETLKLDDIGEVLRMAITNFKPAGPSPGMARPPAEDDLRPAV